MTRPPTEIRVAALERELAVAEAMIMVALFGAHRELDGTAPGGLSPSQAAPLAIDRILNALREHDAVTDELERAKREHVDAFNKNPA